MMKHLALLACSSVIAVSGCARSTDVENVPVGAEVEIVRQDGGVVHGTLTGRDERTVKVDVGKTSRSVPRDQIADVRVVDRTRPAPLPPAAKFREFTLPEGTNLTMRLESSVASDTSHVEDPVEATLTEAVMIDGIEVLPAGSVVRGEVAAVDPAGKVKGRASLALRFTSIAVAGRERTAIVARHEYLAPATKGKDAAKIGIPAAGGAIIGGLLGGKKGAAIGAAVGGGGGTAVVLATSGDEVRMAAGTALSVSTDQASDVRVPITKSP